MRVLITGAGGMLGLDVEAAAARAGHEVTALSRAQLDICDPAAVRTAIAEARPDAVINCAAYTQVDRAQEDSDAASRVNGDGPGVLAAAAAEAGAWLVHVSTDYVFNGAKTSGPYVESDVTGPRSVYRHTKLAGERAVAAAAPQSHTIVRSSWLSAPADRASRPPSAGRALTSRDEGGRRSGRFPHLHAPFRRGAPVAGAVAGNGRGGHVAAGGETTWFRFVQAVLEEAQNFAARGDEADGSRARDHGWATLVSCSTAEYPLPAPRPAYSVLRSERKEVPVLADWRVGSEEYIAARAAAEGSVF